jgi:eukaryotic-like serine/threonine-protein kinase
MPEFNGPEPNLREIYLNAREISEENARNAYLDAACGDNTPMRRRILRMISGDQHAPNPLSNALDHLTPLTSQLADEQEWKQWLETRPLDQSSLPTERFGPYEVIRKLGEGGMGTVYLAQQHTPIKRQVALKVINPGMDSRRILARFRLEQQALARMNHPNITSVLDIGLTARGIPYLVMEWVDGQRIDHFVCDHAVSLEGRLRIFVDICQAVHHAHQRGFIHRDLKPSNVMIIRVDGRYIPKVIDFGVAKALDNTPLEDTRLTDCSQLIGTPEFMSPEQAAWGTQEIDTRSDVYSLGALLYMLVTGAPPLDRDTLRKAGPAQLQQYLQELAPQRPSQRISQDLRGEVSKEVTRRCPLPDAAQALGRVRSELDWIVMKALEKQPERRYDSAGLLAEDVEHFLQGEPVQARPPSIAYQLSRTAKRYRVPLGFATALLLTAFIGGGLAVYNGLQAIAALEKSRENQARTLRLLESSALRQMFEQFAKNNISPPQEDLPREADGEFLRATDRPSSKPAVAGFSLRQLLTHATHPRPELTFQHPGPIYAAVIDEESRRMAVCCGDGCVYVWDLARNKLLHRFDKHFGITTAAFSPEGDTLLTGDQDGSLRAWNLQSGLLIHEEAPAPKGVASITWSPNKSCFAVGFRHGDVAVRSPDYAELFRIERAEPTAPRIHRYFFRRMVGHFMLLPVQLASRSGIRSSKSD